MCKDCYDSDCLSNSCLTPCQIMKEETLSFEPKYSCLLPLQGNITHIYFPQCNSLCRFVTTLQWSCCYNSWEWPPNGHLKLLSPVCLMAGVRHNVDLRLELALSLPGDSGDSSQEPSCPYQVARKYLKSSVPGPISGKGLLRDFWKNTTMFEWVMLMRGQREEEDRDGLLLFLSAASVCSLQ